jgi:hypothetical protein
MRRRGSAPSTSEAPQALSVERVEVGNTGAENLSPTERKRLLAHSFFLVEQGE